MLAAIGETFETPLPTDPATPEVPLQSDLVTGIIMSVRPGFYRISIWTREAPDTTLTESDPLVKRIMTIGRHFKVSVMGYDVDQKLVTGGFQTEVTFESHKVGPPSVFPSASIVIVVDVDVNGMEIAEVHADGVRLIGFGEKRESEEAICVGRLVRCVAWVKDGR